jgi:hypothetical protein
MRLLPNISRRARRGFALLLVTIFTGISLLVLSSILNWTSSSAANTDRNTRYIAASGAAEAGIEKVCASLSRDFQTGGPSRVDANLSSYRDLAPSKEESADWADYTFEVGTSPLSVTRVTNWQYSDLNIRYRGLRGSNATYRVVSRAGLADTASRVQGTLRRDLVLANIPVFGFGIFYAVDLEVCPSASTTITGLVHGNGTNYFQPDSTLTFRSYVTSARTIIHGAHPEDPVFRTPGAINYSTDRDAGIVSLNFPIGTNNTPEVLRQLVEIPPGMEAATSPLGSLRFYNRADMVIRVGDTNVVTTSGAYNNFASSIPWTTTRLILATNIAFFDKRENRTIKTSQIDITALRNNYATFTALLGRNPRTIYVSDERSQTSLTAPGIRIVNGQTIPTAGLTIATPQPLYVAGHFNVPNSLAGSTNTTQSYPAAFVADAVTVLSRAWSDSVSGYDISWRRASATTVNAAVITGIVPTGNGYYSGGYENALRLLEDWRSRTLTFNGSVVVLYYSQYATAPWGASPDVYDTPTRKWNFDLNFMTASKLPPSTPELRVMFRGEWAILSSSAKL